MATTADSVQVNSNRRSALRLLVDRDFGVFFWGKLLSTIATYLHSVVAAIITFSATSSAVAVALVTVAQFAPQLVLAPLAGTQADRGDVGKQIVAGRLLCAAGSGALAVALVPMSGDNSWAVCWIVVAASLVTGLGLVLGGPAMQAVTPQLVRRSELPTAMSLNTIPMTVGRVAGPVAGALLLHLSGPVVAFVVAASCHLVFAAAMPLVRLPKRPRSGKGARVRRSMRSALAHVRRDRPLLLLLVAVTALGFGSEPLTTLAPSFAADLGGDSGTVGALTASFGIGAVIGIAVSAWTAPRFRHEYVLSVGIWLLGLGIASCAVVTSVSAALAANAIAGCGMIIASAGAGTMIQLRVPAGLRGRVMALWLMGFVGSRPIAAITVGIMSDLLSMKAAFLMSAVVVIGVGIACRPAKLQRSSNGLRSMTPRIMPPEVH